jgi:hypothetical protein
MSWRKNIVRILEPHKCAGSPSPTAVISSGPASRAVAVDDLITPASTVWSGTAQIDQSNDEHASNLSMEPASTCRSFNGEQRLPITTLALKHA